MSRRRLERQVEQLKLTGVNRLFEIGRLQARLATPHTTDLRKVASPHLDVHETQHAVSVTSDSPRRSLTADGMGAVDWRRRPYSERSRTEALGDWT
jgi:hypothetical protein